MSLNTASIDSARLAELAGFYRRYLIEDVTAFWEARAADPEGPGYRGLFDRRGRPTGTARYIWCQGRQTYTFASLHQWIDPRPAWLDLARRGRDLLVHQAHAGGGRWHYQLDRSGRVVEPARSLMTDAFALMGLAAYARAAGTDEDRSLIRMGYDAYERNFRTPGFREYHHFDLDPECLWHGPHMITIGMASVLRPVLGEERLRPLVDLCLERVLHGFADDGRRLLFEVLDGDGHVLPTAQGRTINPGHALESMWFCLEEGLHRGDRAVVDRAIEVIRWAYENGRDEKKGGILAFTGPEGGKPPHWQPNAFGEDWDTKIWWVHSEGLYALALAAIEGRSPELWQHFEHLHEYTQRVFADPAFGEWFAYLDRDGTRRVSDKGTWIKSAFHLPRNLMKLTRLLERSADGGGGGRSSGSGMADSEPA